MASLNSLKKQIAALEARVERVTRIESGAAVLKIRKLMADFGVTIEHLAGGASPRSSVKSKKTSAGKPAKKSKGAKPAKYQDPESGATWSGRGRIPGWIANAKSRDAFLIGTPGGAVQEPPAAAVKQPSTKRAASKKIASTAPKVAAKKAAPVKKAAAAKKASAVKPVAPAVPVVAKRAAAKKVPAKAARKQPASKKSAVTTQETGPASDKEPSAV